MDDDVIVTSFKFALMDDDVIVTSFKFALNDCPYFKFY